MKPNTSIRTRSLLCVALLVAASAAHAQYKWVAPDGTVGYSDTPPPDTTATRMHRPPVEDGSESTLPFALRTVAARFPVVLYTTPECQPCAQARSHLLRRGVPFGEKTVSTQADVEAFRALGFGDLAFPALAVGRQRSSGWDSPEWDRLLDAAGYPKTSMLTASYRYPAAESLAPTPQRVAPTTAAAGPLPSTDADAPATARVRPAPQAAVPLPVPPAGGSSIRF